MKQIEVALKRPFKLSQLKWRKGQGNSGDLVYITARDVMDRLDQVFGVEGWETRFEYMGERVVCYLTCVINGKKVTKADGSEDTKIEAAKGGLSKALVRASVHFGIGRYLYHPNAFDPMRKPASWATPEGYDAIMAEREGKEIVEWRKEYSDGVQNRTRK